MAEQQALRDKVDDFLRAALVETDDELRARLIAKATYWHQVAVRRDQTDAALADVPTRAPRAKG